MEFRREAFESLPSPSLDPCAGSGNRERMNDQLFHGRIEPGRIGFSFVDAAQAVNEAVIRRDCDPYSAHLLGRAMAGGLLLLPGLQDGVGLNIRWHYAGALKTLLIDARADGRIRGLISPYHLSENGDDADAFLGEQCRVQVTRIKGPKVLSESSAESVMQDVVDDLAYFRCISDQVETSGLVMIGFRPDPESPVERCRGILLHAMPDTDLEHFNAVRNRLANPEIRECVGSSAAEGEAAVKELLEAVCQGVVSDPEITCEAGPTPRFFCSCSDDKMGELVCMLPIPDRMEIMEKGDPLVIHCEFCSKRYELDLDTCVRHWNAFRDDA